MDCSVAHRCCASPIWPSTAAISRRPEGEHRDRRPDVGIRSTRQRSCDPRRRRRAPDGDELAAAREAHLFAVAAAKYYIDYSDFTLWVLRVQRVRWVGGYGRMESTTGDEYSAAAPDPVQPQAAGAIDHLNADHADSLVAMAKVLGGYPDTTAATCTGLDRYGLDLQAHHRPRDRLHPGRLRSADRLGRPIAFGHRRAGAPGAAGLNYRLGRWREIPSRYG